MTNPEIALFDAFLKNAGTYVEFGCGGSTLRAAAVVTESVISVDSSKDWLDKVQQSCEVAGTKVRPNLVFADIGPIGDWGRPTDSSTKHLWPNYYSRIWEYPESKRADLYLVDGRFRVSCFMSIALHSRVESVILVHDFTSRPYYHIIRTVAREIAQAGDLSAFLVSQPCMYDNIANIIGEHQFDYA